MEPVSIQTVEALPYLANGKVDRRRILTLAAAARPDTMVTVGTDDTQRAMEVIWMEVLGEPVAPPNATFFELGGESLAAMRILSRITERWGLELTFRDLYDNPTVKGLNDVVQSALRRSNTLPSESPVRR